MQASTEEYNVVLSGIALASKQVNGAPMIPGLKIGIYALFNELGLKKGNLKHRNEFRYTNHVAVINGFRFNSPNSIRNITFHCHPLFPNR
jgi:hypothetical protein